MRVSNEHSDGKGLPFLIVITKRRVSFIVIGFWNTIFTIFCFGLLTQLTSKQFYPITLAVTYLLSSLQSHFLYRHIVWKSTNTYSIEFLRFGVMSVFLYFLNLAILRIIHEIWELNLIISQILISFSIAGISFVIQKKLVYRSLDY